MLARYVGRDLAANSGLAMALHDSAVELRLPAYRSHVHRPAAFAGRIDYAEIAALETRCEVFRSCGVTAWQRAWAIRRGDGSALLLGEDRWLGGPDDTGVIGAWAARLAGRAGVAITDLGTVRGRPGLLLVAGASVEPWPAADRD